jgi:hypothetical protein
VHALGQADAALHAASAGLMMASYCSLLDRAGHMGYLETDKPGNVAFYELHGFETVAEADVLAVPNWFMHRQPRA